jgi:hypothetical protein
MKTADFLTKNGFERQHNDVWRRETAWAVYFVSFRWFGPDYITSLYAETLSNREADKGVRRLINEWKTQTGAIKGILNAINRNAGAREVGGALRK